MAVPWLINGGDPNHLLDGMILQAIYSSSIEDGHRQSEQKDNFKKMEQQNKEVNFHGDNAERQRRHSETNELKAKGRQSEYEGHPPDVAASWPRLRWTHQQLDEENSF